MKKFYILSILISLLAQPLSAVEKSGLFTVDLTKILRLSEFGKKILIENNAARQKLQSENEILKQRLLIEEKELSVLRETLSIDEFRPKALQFDEKVTIIRAEQGEKEQNLVKKARKEESEFFKKIYPLLYELLLERGGLVLIDQRNVILWDSSVDITDDAIKLVNRVFGDGTQTN